MPLGSFGNVPDRNASSEELADAFSRLLKEVTYLLNGGLDTLNVNELHAEVIIAGTITTAKLNAGAVTADKMTVSQLSAIAADMGTITAGSITTNAQINVGTDAHIGNKLYLKETDATGQKGVVFSTVTGQSGSITVLSGDMSITMSGFLTLSPGSSQGVVVNGKLTSNDLHALNGLNGTFYVATTPGGVPNTAVTFVDGIAR